MHTVEQFPGHCLIRDPHGNEVCTTPNGVEAARSLARKLDAFADLVAFMQSAAAQLLRMEEREQDGDTPRGSDCGYLARRILNVLEHAARD